MKVFVHLNIHIIFCVTCYLIRPFFYVSLYLSFLHLSLSLFQAPGWEHLSIHLGSHSQLSTVLVSLTFTITWAAEEAVRHLVPLKFETGSRKAIGRICPLMLWKVTSKGCWILADGHMNWLFSIFVSSLFIQTEELCGALTYILSTAAKGQDTTEVEKGTGDH